jgi:hypothetical protein
VLLGAMVVVSCRSTICGGDYGSFLRSGSIKLVSHLHLLLKTIKEQPLLWTVGESNATMIVLVFFDFWANKTRWIPLINFFKCLYQAWKVSCLINVLEILKLRYIFICCVLRSVLWCPLRFPHKYDVDFVFCSSCLLRHLCLFP